MARKNINIGSGINTGTGDTLRNAMSKVNDNFEELYNNVFGGDSTVLDLKANSITATNTNGQLTLSVNGSGQIIMDANVIFNQEIRSDDSTGIDIADDLRIQGSLRFGSDGQSISAILDEDTMSSDSDTALATQQSIKAYVDAQTTSAGSLTIVDDGSTTVDINLATDSLTVAGGTGITTAISGDTITITGLELLDEDNLGSNSETAVASQQSIKAYVDSQITSTNTLTIADDTSSVININLDNTLTVTGGDSITTSVSGQSVTIDLDENITVNQISSTDSTEVQVADNLVPTANNTYALGSADKKWSALHVAGGSIFLGDLILKDNGDNTLGIFQSDGTTPAFVQGVTQIKFVGDDSTGTAFNLDETIKIAGNGIVTTSVSGDTITITATEANDLGLSVTWVDVPDANITQSSVTQHQAALSITQSQISDFNSPITIVGDDSTGVTLNTGETIKITGTQNITSTVSGDTLTLTGPDLSSFITASTLEFVGDDSTGTVFDASQGDNVKFAGTNGIAVSVAGDTVTIDGSALAVGGGLTFVGDDSTGTVVSLGETFKIAGSGLISTSVSEDVLTITASNLTVSDFAASAIVTEAEGLQGSNDNDTTIPTSAAVIDLVNWEEVTSVAGSPSVNVNTKNAINVNTSGTILLPSLSASLGDFVMFADGSTDFSQNPITISRNGRTIDGVAQDFVLDTKGQSIGFVYVNSNWSTFSNSIPTQIKVVGDDSTGITIEETDTIKFAGSQNITTSVTGDTVTITGPDLSSYLTDISFRIVGDDSASVEINNNGTILFNGESNITTSTTSDGVVTITGPDISSFITASSSDALTNKTIDANDTGNAITNLEVADFAAGVVDTDLSSVSGADDTLASAKAIVSYVDTSVSQLSQTIQISDDTSTVLTLDLQDDTLSLAGGNSITTAISGDTITIALDKAIDVNTISSGDSTAIIVNDGLRVEGDANFQQDVEVYGTLYVNNIQGEDSTQLTINQNIDVLGVMRVRELQSEDSTQVLINDGMRIDGALNVQGGAEIYGTLYAQEIGAEDSTQLTFLDAIQVRGLSSTINDLTITTNNVDTVTVSTQGGEKLVIDADNGLIDLIATTVDFTGNVIIEGNLTVQGSETIVNTTTLEVEDNRVIVANNNSADVTDFGFFGHYYSEDSTAPNHAGIWRDATNKEWYFMASYDPEPIPLTIDRTGDSYSSASINALNVTAEGSFIIGSANLNETDITKLDGITNGTVTANKALVVDGNKDIATIGNLTSNQTITAVTGDYQTIKVNTIESDDSTSVTVNDGLIVAGNFAFDGGVAVSTILDEDGFGSDSDTALATQQSIKAYVDAQDANIASDSLVFTNKTIDANGTGNSISNLEVADFASGVVDTDLSSVSASDDTLASAKSIKAYVDAEDANIASDSLVFTNKTFDANGTGNALSNVEVADFAASAIVTVSETLASNDSDTALVTAGAIIDYVDAEDANIASDSLVFTNKTFDANGTGNSISNLEVADFASGVVDTDLSSVSASDDTLASAKAIKAYVDTQLTAESLSFQADSGGTLTVDLDSQTFGVTGGDSITTVGSGQSVTIDLDETITVNRITSTDSVAVAMEGVIVEGYLTFGGEGDPAPKITSILDEDGMGSDSDTALATQQSIKAYVDTAVSGVSTTSITEGNSSVAVADSGSGSVTVTIDGATHTTFDANGLSTNVLNSTDSTAIQVTDALNVSGAVTAAGGFVGDLTGTASAVADNSVALGTKTTGNYVDSLVAGALIDLQNNTGEGATPTIDVDLSELATSTTDGDGDFFVVVDSSNVQRKLTKANIAISGFNTANGIALGTDTTGNYVATITGGTGIDSTGATTGEGIAHTLSLDLNELTTSTSNADGDFFVVVDSVGAQHKLTKANIDISEFNTADQIALGTDTTGAYVQQGATSGNGISGSVNSEGGTFTVSSNATDANTGSTIVFRDGSGNFSAGTITANLSGTATTATNVTATANDATNETVYLTFVDGQTGAQGIETDVNLTYNPSTNVISSTAAAAQYSDLAERFEADAEYEMGTVMVIGGDAEVTQSTQEGSTDVVGVVSSVDQAGFTMNTGAGTDATHPLIALAGRVQIKVVGAVNKGDRLIASATPGCARRADLDDCTAFNVIGRALETKTSTDIDTVLCLTVARL